MVVKRPRRRRRRRRRRRCRDICEEMGRDRDEEKVGTDGARTLVEWMDETASLTDWGALRQIQSGI